MLERPAFRLKRQDGVIDGGSRGAAVERPIGEIPWAVTVDTGIDDIALDAREISAHYTTASLWRCHSGGGRPVSA